jgi:hypothetical protein
LVSSSLETFGDVIVVLARASTSDLRTFKARKSAVTDSTLAVACESILSGKAIAAGALVGLVATVNLCVALQVVLSDEALAAVIALELAITKMGLDVGTDVLLAAELLVAPIEETGPLAIAVILGADEALDILGRDTGVLDASVDVESLQHSLTRRYCRSLRGFCVVAHVGSGFAGKHH